jgi:hypothetical protein
MSMARAPSLVPSAEVAGRAGGGRAEHERHRLGLEVATFALGPRAEERRGDRLAWRRRIDRARRPRRAAADPPGQGAALLSPVRPAQRARGPATSAGRAQRLRSRPPAGHCRRRRPLAGLGTATIGKDGAAEAIVDPVTSGSEPLVSTPSGSSSGAMRSSTWPCSRSTASRPASTCPRCDPDRVPVHGWCMTCACVVHGSRGPRAWPTGSVRGNLPATSVGGFRTETLPKSERTFPRGYFFSACQAAKRSAGIGRPKCQPWP